MINYTAYPSLLFCSYDRDSAPKELPFQVASVQVRDFLAGSKGYHEMFGLIANFNSMGLSPTNYFLNDKKFKDVEYNEGFRNSHFRDFISSYKKETQYGCICFKDGGQYVYLYIPEGKSKLKGLGSGAYICGAMFMSNFFIGFEEGVIDRGFAVMPTGHYENGMDVGGYLSFITICLSFFKEGTVPLPSALNNTKEKIWTKN